uniref:Uncharacterized protein n=1 Tax=Arundo donax TaxID=35708 RepID=A0A0A9DUH2_ARUDO
MRTKAGTMARLGRRPLILVILFDHFTMKNNVGRGNCISPECNSQNCCQTRCENWK